MDSKATRALKRLVLLFLLAAVGTRAQNVPYSNIVISAAGRPIAGAGISVCNSPGLATTAASVSSNLVTLTMASNPITAGFAANMTLQVSGFTGGDTYLNGGTLSNSVITGGFTILSVTSTTIVFQLSHANATAASNGFAFQQGNISTPCAPLASITSDQAGLTPITQPGLASNNLGNFSFYALAGPYVLQYSGTGVVVQLQPIAVPVSTANNNIFTGQQTVANLNGTIYCDGVTNTSLNAANAAALLTPGVGIIIANGSNCPVTSNLTIQTQTPLIFQGSGTVPITIPTGVTLTIGGPITAPPTQIFNLQGTGKVVFATSAPQAVTVYPHWWGAKCDGTTDDTNAFQQAINAVSFFQNQTGAFGGGTVMIPAGVPQACKVSTLNLDNTIGLTIRNGMGGGMGNSANPTITFTGNCTSAACLSMRSSTGNNFYGLILNFPNAVNAAAGMIDLEHCIPGAGCNGNDSAYVGFHGVQFKGPGSGTIINARQVDFVTFDAWSLFSNAGVFVNGSCQTYTSGLCTTASNSEFSDHVIFRDVNFSAPTVAAIQNASASWQINSSEFQNNNVVAFLNYSGGYTQMQDLLIQSFEETGIPAANSTVFTLFTLPAASGNVGGITIEGSLLLGSTAQAANQIMLNLGNNQKARVHGNVIQLWDQDFVVGTGVTLNVDSNVIPAGSFNTLLTGTPAVGRIENPTTGQSTVYETVNMAQTIQPISNGCCNLGGAAARWFNIFASNYSLQNLLISNTAPTIAAAGCGGAAAAIVSPNGTGAFKVNVGTTPGSACTFTFPAATTGWNVHCDDITTQSTSVFVQKQTGAESTTSVTITNFNDVAVPTAFVASDILKCTASAD